jgi:BlaI family penicillinase repressor
MKKTPKKSPAHSSQGPVSISEAEWSVMELLWNKSPQTSPDLCATLEKSHHWKRATVMTLLNRLIKKQVISTEEDGRRWLYSAAVARDRCVSRETRGFLDRLFHGALLPMVAHCLEHEELSEKEIDELRALLNRSKGKA